MYNSLFFNLILDANIAKYVVGDIIANKSSLSYKKIFFVISLYYKSAFIIPDETHLLHHKNIDNIKMYVTKSHLKMDPTCRKEYLKVTLAL